MKVLRIVAALSLALSFNVLLAASSEATPAPGLNIEAFTFNPASNHPSTEVGLTPCNLGISTVANINVNWGGGGPGGDCPSDFFIIHYYGYITYDQSETVVFRNISDDGFKMSINNQSVINDWNLHGCWGQTGSFTFEANAVYPIDVWMYEYGGGACSILYWTTAQNGYTVVPPTAFMQTLPIVPTPSPSTPPVTEPSSPPSEPQNSGDSGSQSGSPVSEPQPPASGNESNSGNQQGSSEQPSNPTTPSDTSQQQPTTPPETTPTQTEQPPTPSNPPSTSEPSQPPAETSQPSTPTPVEPVPTPYVPPTPAEPVQPPSTPTPPIEEQTPVTQPEETPNPEEPSTTPTEDEPENEDVQVPAEELPEEPAPVEEPIEEPLPEQTEPTSEPEITLPEEQPFFDEEAPDDTDAGLDVVPDELSSEPPVEESTDSITEEEKEKYEEIGIEPNSPDQLPEDEPKLPDPEDLKPRIQVDVPGVENGGIEFFGTKSQPQVIGEDGQLTPPPPPPGSGLPIPPDAITTVDTFIGQPGGTTFNAPDVATPMELVPVDVPAALDAIPGAGEAVQALNEAYVELANIGNDMSPVTRKKAKKVLIATIVVGQIAQLRRLF